MERSDIVQFYQNQTIFVTGGTGFLGKVLVEKLLRVCSPKHINILTRPKKGKNVEERYDDFFNCPCFDRLKNEKDDFKSKISFVGGDCEAVNLGIDDQQAEVLKNETTIVIHAAANVKFNQSLRVAANINVRGTKDVLELAKSMPKLKAFVYVSTAYSNCPHSVIKEEMYDPPMTAQQLLSIVNAIDDDILEDVTPKLLGKWPNTYVFTKSIAEGTVETEGKELPIAIVRPAIVGPTLTEPISGWTANLYGICGIILAAALGVLKSLYVKCDNVAQLVPCDYVTNVILAAAWSVHQDKRSHTASNFKRNLTIYNYVGSSTNFITWRSLKERLEETYWDSVTSKAVWYYTFNMRENLLWHNTVTFFCSHTLFSYMVDFLMICVGKQPIAVQNYKRIDHLLSLTSYFTSNSWDFRIDNVTTLWSKMADIDKQLFKFDMDDLDWTKSIKNTAIGGRIYVLKDPLDTLPQAKRRLRLLQVIHYAFNFTCYLILFMIFWWIFHLFL